MIFPKIVLMNSPQLLLPKQCLLCRVPGGVCYGRAMGTSPVTRLVARANVSVFTVLGEGRARLVQAKWSVVSFSMVKHICFDNFYLRVAPGPPGSSWVLHIFDIFIKILIYSV